MKVHLLIIATNKYNRYVLPLLESVDKFFLKDHQVEITLFTDLMKWKNSFGTRLRVNQYEIPSYKFPEATLYRYRVFTDYSLYIDGDYVFYIDADSLIVSPVQNEILQQDLIVTQHPGFYANQGWGSPGVVKESMAYVKPENRSTYVCGGFNGGTTESFMKMSSILADNIDQDEKNNARAEWHDESALNWYISQYTTDKVLILDPSYMMVENQAQRRLWKIDHLQPKILALDKVHKEARS